MRAPVGGDIAFLGESYINSNRTTRIPDKVIKEFNLEEGNAIVWMIKNNVLFVRFHPSKTNSITIEKKKG
jgi:antitoxin component of MazEF toxin-antitoxin module